jgi:DNA-binding MarR family transcriptional regulator
MYKMNSNVKEPLELVMQQLKELSSIYLGAAGQIGISKNEFWIWYTLVLTDGEYSQRDIWLAWSMSKQTVNTIVNHMVQKGYAVLEVVPGTRNRKIIRLTEAGKQYGESIVIPVCSAQQRALDRLTPEEFLAATAAIRKFIATLKEEINDAKFE